MFWPILALLYLPIFFVAAKKSSHEQLIDLAAAGNGVIRLDEHSFDLLTTPQRNWTAAIQFTAMGKRMKCNPCKEFDPSWNEVAKAWATVPKPERDNHFFGTIDFDDAMVVFQKLNLASAPVVHVYPATEGPRSTGKTTPYKYDFSHGFEAEPLANQLSSHTPVPIPYKAPIDWARWGTMAAFIPIITLAFRFISPALKSRWVWAAGTIMVSLIMTSGYMFTRIRASPYSGPNGEWIAQGYSNQFGQEVQVVSMIYGIAGAAILMLTIVTPYQMSPARQRTQVYLWTAVNVIMFSILVSLFRVKNRGYPFKLLF